MRAANPMSIRTKEIADLALKQIDWLDELVKKGMIKFTAPYVGRRARVMIFDVKSNEELFEIINQDPLFPFTDRRIIPLSNNTQIKKHYQRLKKDGFAYSDL